MFKVPNRIREIIAPTFDYCVWLSCPDCLGHIAFTIIRAKSPEHAKTKFIDRMQMQGITIWAECTIEVEQI
jgi:hypothetical protein